MGDLDRERNRRLEPVEELPPGEVWLPGERAFVGQVTTTTPTVGTFALVTPQRVGGNQTEGSTGVFTALAGSVPVFILGPAAPVTGDLLVCRWSEHRWVAERGTGAGGGGGTIGIPCVCGNLLNTTLNATFVSSNFFNPGYAGIITYTGSPPSGCTRLGYYSPMQTDGIGQSFYYVVSCRISGELGLYKETLTGGTFSSEDIIGWWNGGATGNICLPFSFTNFTISPTRPGDTITATVTQ